MAITRREMLRRSAGGLGLLVAGQAGMLRLATPSFAAPPGPGGCGFGPLKPDPDGILELPNGFSYQVLTVAGRPLVSGAGFAPGRPDGSASFAGRLGESYKVMNHEQSTSADHPAVAAANLTYDPGALGGTTTLHLDRHNNLIGQYVSLAGTFNNCAGGLTPWGSWLTCEETETKAGGALTKDHGFVFEVNAADPNANLNPTPLKALGRYAHEAVVVDPMRGHLYLTEDASSPTGLLYRFTPATLPNRLHSLRDGGTLEAMRIVGVPDLSVFTTIGATLPVTWVPVPDPQAASLSVRKQFNYKVFPAGTTQSGPGGDVTRSKKFEGAWWGDDKAYIVCSFAHGAVDWSDGNHDGQVWAYDPNQSTLRLVAYFPRNVDPEGAGADQPDGPDNITVNPWGGLFIAEDGEGPQHLVAIADDGTPAVFARNVLSGSEFTGVHFSPDRMTLYASIQDEGYTLAISGPFARFKA